MKEISMSKKNKDGKEIIKKVPENIASTYANIGWKIVKENSKQDTNNKKYGE